MIKFRGTNIDGDYLSFHIYGPQTADGTVAEAIIETTVSQWNDPQNWLDNNQIEAQSLIDASNITGTAFCIRQEAKNFIADNPAALQLIELGPDTLESAIENRTAGQETLLLKTLAFAVRVLYAESQET